MNKTSFRGGGQSLAVAEQACSHWVTILRTSGYEVGLYARDRAHLYISRPHPLQLQNQGQIRSEALQRPQPVPLVAHNG